MSPTDTASRSDRIPYTLGDYFGVIRRRWIYVATILPVAVLVAIYIAYTLPPLYRSSGVVLLEPSSIPEDMIRTTVTAVASEQLELVWQRIFTTENLILMVERLDPYPQNPELTPQQKADNVRDATYTERVDPIELDPMVESNAFSVSYVNPDRALAQAVTGELVQMFLDYSRITRTEQATSTREFLQVRADDAQRQVLDLERKVAEFRARYTSALPEERLRNQGTLERIQRDLGSNDVQTLLAEERKRALELQLGQINPNLFDPAGDWRTELAALRTALAEARQRYTENHPDVRRLTRAIEEMSQRTDLATEVPIAPDNPDYITIASQLDTVNQQLAFLHASSAEMRAQIDLLEGGMAMAPEVEREYAQLTRDLDTAQRRFTEIQTSLNDASLAVGLETEQRGLRYSLHRPPTWPRSPYSPNRLGIILLAIVLGGAVSVGLAALHESSDPTVRSARDLLEITDITPLGAVPVILNRSDKRQRVLAWGMAVAVAALVISFIGSVVS